MHSHSHAPTDPIAWARRINNRWIVHEGLNSRSNAYMDHLQKTDPERLRLSCMAAWQMTHSGDALEDPKPRFYGGLFCLASPKEAKQFLSHHEFILRIIPAFSINTEDRFTKNLIPATKEQITQLRSELAKLSKEIQTGSPS